MLRTHHLAVATLAALAAPTVAQPAWQPSRPVEFIATAGAGGGTDTFARTVQAIIQRHNLIATPIIVVNKGGGSGAEGFVHGRAAASDPHKLIFATSNQWMLPLVARVGWRAQDLTPVAAMAYDEFLLWVRQDAPYRTAADYIAAARAAPGELRMGGSQSRDVDQILTNLLQRASGVRFTYVPFRSGGELNVQLVGGHLHSHVNNPAESIGQWRAGQMRPLCVFSRDRLPRGPRVTEGEGWADVPTCREQGIALEEYRMPRTVFLPGKVPLAAIAYWADLLRRVSEMPEWREFTERTSQTAQFMAGEELRRFIAEDERRGRDVAEAEGWLVN